MNKHYFILRRYITACLLISYFLSACNKSYSDAEPYESYNDSSALLSNTKKVLYIIVDGANGEVVRDLKLPNINRLATTGIYTWNSISGFEVNDTSLQASWANMMTGVYSSLNKTSTTFDTSNFATYPSFIDRVQESGKKVISYSTTSEFESVFTAKGTKHESTGDDLTTANALINAANEDVDVLVGEFNNVYQEGIKSSFDFSDAGYTNALKKVDNYIGSIINSIKNRPNYNKERWLFVITSTANLTRKERTAGDPTAFGDPRLNTFSILSNDKFIESYLPKPLDTRGTVNYSTTALRFRGAIGEGNNDGNRITVTDTKQLFNCPPGDSLTVEAKIKINPKSDGTFSYSYPPFLSKTAARNGNTTGWSFFRSANAIVLWVGTGISNHSVTSSQITDNNWHTIAGKMQWDGSQLSLYIYIDGVVAGANTFSIETPNSTMINSNSPLVMGHWGSVFSTQFFDFYLKDVRIWNKGLTDAQISSYSCYPSELLPEDLSYRQNLVGDYRIESSDVSSVKDYSISAQNGLYELGVNGKLEWRAFDEISNAICPTANDNYYKATINGVDMPYVLFSWLGLRIDPSWDFSGKYWTPTLNTSSN